MAIPEINITADQAARLNRMGLKWPPAPITLDRETRLDLEALGAYEKYLEKEIERAKRAKLDTSSLEATLKSIRDMRAGLLTEY